MRLKTKLKHLLNAPKATSKPLHNFEESQEVRDKIKQFMNLPISDFCRNRPSFDMKHGLVHKLLKTDPSRLANGVLTTHDMNYWLRQNKPVPALWIIRLAGKKGQVARNQFLKWSNENLGGEKTKQILNWTKKWGIAADSYAQVATVTPTTVDEARKQYAERTTKGVARQILGNTLLKSVASTGEPNEVYAFYKSLNKDVVTFQVMFAAMMKNPGLLQYWEDIWGTAQRQERANNIKIDDKLRETAEVAKQRRAKTSATSGESSQEV